MSDIIIITPGFAANEADENCIPPLQLLVRSLIEINKKVHVIALEYPFRNTPYQWHGVTVYPCNGHNRLWLRWRTHGRAYDYASQIMETHTVSNIHSFWLGQSWLVGEALHEKYGIPHTTTLMGQDARMLNNRFYLSKVRPHHVERMVALSGFHAQQFEQNTGFFIPAVIPWGIQPAEMPKAVKGARRDIDIIGVGSLLPVKNWDRWLRLILSVSNSLKPLKVVLVGDGPELERLEQWSASKGLDDIIQFAGSLPRHEVLLLMQRSKVLLHTSNYESYGFVLAEAAASGCHVVSTPVGIAEEMGFVSSNDFEIKTHIVAYLNEISHSGTPDSEMTYENIFTIQDTAAHYLQFWHDIGYNKSSV